MNSDYDILIIGGGMVGASLAHALRDIPLRIGIVEAVPLQDQRQPSYDSRAIALSYGSRQIFNSMGVWQAMASRTVTPITRIQVSDRGHFGATRMDAAEERVEALGYVVEAGVIGRALAAELQQLPHVELLCPASLQSLQHEEEHILATVQREDGVRTVSTKLLVAADGGRSTVRELSGAKSLQMGYGQTAVIANVITDRPHNNIAYERFTNTGPLALLPNTAPHHMEGAEAGERRWSLVWTVRDEQVEETLALSDEAFLARLQQRFGGRAGNFESVTARHAYPLGLHYVRDHIRPRMAFIGNAAHTLHPVGGQGFNLGLRDVAALAEVLSEAHHNKLDPGQLKVLRQYADWRKPDYARAMAFTDGLARIFSTDFTPIAAARNLGLLAMDLLPPLRRAFARQAMGLTGKQSRLARGRSLRS